LAPVTSPVDYAPNGWNVTRDPNKPHAEISKVVVMLGKERIFFVCSGRAWDTEASKRRQELGKPGAGRSGVHEAHTGAGASLRIAPLFIGRIWCGRPGPSAVMRVRVPSRETAASCARYGAACMKPSAPLRKPSLITQVRTDPCPLPIASPSDERLRFSGTVRAPAAIAPAEWLVAVAVDQGLLNDWYMCLCCVWQHTQALILE
jgi:hypothetical protein